MNRKEKISLGDRVFILDSNKIIELIVVEIITTIKYIEVGELGPQNEKIEEIIYVLQDEKFANYGKLNKSQERFQTDVVFKTKENLVNSLIK